jgi:hypothetical protein
MGALTLALVDCVYPRSSLDSANMNERETTRLRRAVLVTVDG